MLTIQQIQNYYPPKLQSFKRNMLREYLQYKILESIYESEYANSLIFLGGTALRILYENQRFSEDLDFDNQGLSEFDFEKITKVIAKTLEKEGLDVEFRTVFKGAFHCYIKFPQLLFQHGLTSQRREKIYIRLDTFPQKFDYSPDKKLLNFFDVFTEVFVVPLDILLSQKIYAILDRKTAKGRDYFDVAFLISRTQPNYKYLSEKIGINNIKKLKTRLLQHCKPLDFNKLANDIEPFLFEAKQKKQILLFEEIIEKLDK